MYDLKIHSNEPQATNIPLSMIFFSCSSTAYCLFLLHIQPPQPGHPHHSGGRGYHDTFTPRIPQRERGTMTMGGGDPEPERYIINHEYEDMVLDTNYVLYIYIYIIHVSYIYTHMYHIYIYMYHIYIHVSYLYICIIYKYICICIIYIFKHMYMYHIYIHMYHI